MAAVGVEEDPTVQAAKILLTLRNRKLLRWPEWVQMEPATAVVEVRWPLEGWPKRPRSGGRLQGDWRAGMAPPKLKRAASSASAGSGPCSSGEERERSPAPPRWRERPSSRDELMAAQRPDSPAYCSALAGSGLSTSDDRKARPRHAVEKAARASFASVSASTTKEPMKVSSPETPLDFAAAGSGASSSGDDAVLPPSKRRAPGALRSGGGTSSSDEGCSSPDKRVRVDSGDGDGEKAISEPKMQTPDDSKKAVKFEFDLNMLPEDEECPGFC